MSRFLASHPEFELIPWPKLWEQSLPGQAPVPSADGSSEMLLMTPRGHGTDGFFVAVIERSGRPSQCVTRPFRHARKKFGGLRTLSLEIHNKVAEMTRVFLTD
jgi:hypothetical protein